MHKQQWALIALYSVLVGLGVTLGQRADVVVALNVLLVLAFWGLSTVSLLALSLGVSLVAVYNKAMFSVFVDSVESIPIAQGLFVAALVFSLHSALRAHV
jgi:hypothetical protein